MQMIEIGGIDVEFSDFLALLRELDGNGITLENESDVEAFLVDREDTY